MLIIFFLPTFATSTMVSFVPLMKLLHFDFRQTDMHADRLTYDARSRRVKRTKFFLPIKLGLGPGPLLIGPIIIPIIPAIIAG